MPSFITPKKHFSQNFLVDKIAREKVLHQMKTICDLREVPVVEIGPGQGDVTKYALEWQKPFTAIEIDPEAVQYLTENIDKTLFPNFRLIHEDAMLVMEDLEKYDLPIDFSLISSLPYHIGSRILVDLAVRCPKVNFAVIHQKEVITKVLPKYDISFFGAWLNLFWNCKYALELPPHCFFPQPKVYSGVMTGISKNSQDLDWLDTRQKRELAKNVLKKLFAFPNKTLSNNLKGLDYTTDQIQEFLQKHCNGNKNTRLGWDNYLPVLKAVCVERQS
jgi:16S rRNA (adenine1518-N6/adenine1519-N6)-dimethyltransferase